MTHNFHRLVPLLDIERVVGENIRAIRLKKGITQESLADLAGLNPVHLRRLESGRQSMTLRTLKLIAIALNVRVRDLVGKE